MNLIYLANIRMPTERAHGVQIIKMCEAFARAGEKVTLIVPARHTHLTEDPFVYYGVEKIFTIVYVPVWDTVAWGRLGFWFESIGFALRAARAARSYDGLVYGRDELVLAFARVRDAHVEPVRGAASEFEPWSRERRPRRSGVALPSPAPQDDARGDPGGAAPSPR